MVPPNRRLQENSDDPTKRLTVTPAPAGGTTTYLVQRRSLMELFYVGIYTGSSFSVIFIISESIPIFMEEALPDDWNPASVRGISIAVWCAINLAFVYALSRIIPLSD